MQQSCGRLRASMCLAAGQCSSAASTESWQYRKLYCKIWLLDTVCPFCLSFCPKPFCHKNCFCGGGQTQASYDMPLAQFFTEAFAAAEGTGAAAIMPYKYIPYAYTYQPMFYEFGINTDAGAYAVPRHGQAPGGAGAPRLVAHPSTALALAIAPSSQHSTPSAQLCTRAPQHDAAEAARGYSASQQGRHQQLPLPHSVAQLLLPDGNGALCMGGLPSSACKLQWPSRGDRECRHALPSTVIASLPEYWKFPYCTEVQILHDPCISYVLASCCWRC